MPDELLDLRNGGKGLQVLVNRAVGIDGGVSVRLRQLTEYLVDVFVTTPFEVVVSRRVEGKVSRDGAVVSGYTLQQQLVHNNAAGELELGPARDPMWPGALPPADGFRLLDTLPVAVVRELADKGQALARQFAGPLGPPTSLMNQSVLTVAGEDKQVDVPMRMIFACTNLGLIPGFSAPMDVPRYLRVSAQGRWVRIDAPYGTVYHSNRLSLF